MATTQPRRYKRLSRLLWLLVVLVAALGILLPSASIAELGDRYPWLEQAVYSLRRLWPGGDMIHLLLFAGIGVLTAVAFPKRRLAWLAVALVGLAGATELAQLWIPGRTASTAEFVIDVVAAVVGLVVGRGLRRAWEVGRRA